jgi:phage terminase small subunit
MMEPKSMLDNPKHEAFANYVLSEPSQAEAYRKAYPHAAKWKPESAQIAACRLAKNAKVALRIQELKQELVKRTLWTRESSVKVLARIALKGERDSDKISSIKELNAMHCKVALQGSY